jgi:hypothetical protein
MSDNLPEAPGTPLRALIDKSYRFMARTDVGWVGAQDLVREAFRLGAASAPPEASGLREALLAVSTDVAQDGMEDPCGYADREAAGFYRIGRGAMQAVRAALAATPERGDVSDSARRVSIQQEADHVPAERRDVEAEAPGSDEHGDAADREVAPVPEVRTESGAREGADPGRDRRGDDVLPVAGVRVGPAAPGPVALAATPDALPIASGPCGCSAAVILHADDPVGVGRCSSCGQRWRSCVATPDARPDPLITVCDQCLTASCWHGVFMCQRSFAAGTIRVPRSDLARLNREHSDYWKPDAEVAETVAAPEETCPACDGPAGYTEVDGLRVPTCCAPASPQATTPAPSHDAKET